MELGLQDKVALITGGSQGIGRGIAEILSSEGTKSVICSIDDDDVLFGAAKEISAATGNEVFAIHADLTNEEDVSELVRTTTERFGQIDILVNNAGSSVFGYFEDISNDDWLAGFKLKLFGYVRLTKLVVPLMKQQGSGVIINVVGNAGRSPIDWHMPGGAANSALLNFTKTLSNQVAKHGIRVVAVNPGPTQTARGDKVVSFISEHEGISKEEVLESLNQRCPMGRFATVEDVGNAVAFLAADKASHITGTSLTIDGGWSQLLP
jgi:NAD(P)-dependent dehydrogenase (short-subunit alcohol dehydrogenase family)